MALCMSNPVLPLPLPPPVPPCCCSQDLRLLDPPCTYSPTLNITLPAGASAAFLRDHPEPGHARSGAPLLPVAIVNSHRALGTGQVLPRLVPLQLRVGEPVPAPASRRRADLDATTAILQQRINALLELDPLHP